MRNQHVAIRPDEELVEARISTVQRDQLGRVQANYIDLDPGEYAVGTDGLRYGEPDRPYRFHLGSINEHPRIIIVVRKDDFVQVQVSGASPTYPWTYIDPSGELEVGDRVLVPFGYDNAERVAKVMALGKGFVPAGITIKPVAARLEVEVLEAA